ncbi:MAG: hypothetical protein WAN50_04390, partial [Minisyncoccia bacterium]
MDGVICVTGVSSIQDYVFGTNRLRENVGGSGLVEHSSRQFRGFAEADDGKPLFTGGGNNAAVFYGEDALARTRGAVWEWSRRFLRIAPGLRLTAAHEPFTAGRLAEAYLQARERLAQVEEAPPFGAPLGALPLSRYCSSTRGPASSKEDGDWLSDEALAKRKFENDHRDDRFPRRLDLLDRDGASHIAIIHADGDGIGASFKELADDFSSNGRSDDDFRSAIRRKSEQLDSATRTAFDHILSDLQKLKPALIKDGIIDPSNYENDPQLLPIRPIIRAGDDVTFITPGRIGLSLAVRYLESFHRAAKEM